MESKRISVHVSSDDLETRLPVLLDSLSSQTIPDWQAVIVDNSVTKSAPPTPPVYVLRNLRPQGLARSMSQAIELASGAEFFVLARPDLIFAPNMLQVLLDEFQKDESLVFAWPSLARATHNPESSDGELLFSDDRILPKRSEDLPASCVMVRTQDIGSLRPDPRRGDDTVIMDFLWKLTQTGAKGRQVEEAIAWLQPGATLASPGFLRYWTWVWTRRAPRS
ncbi:glycosyltransferase family 2 protein [Candidatus Uhrbacteria bacterium]|nr:glycosyltransferase family 2 protein [Candidatus Uhrbacteria bacterium]